MQATNTSNTILHNKMNTLKAYITDTTFLIEKKEIDIFITTNYGHYVSNNNNCFRLLDRNRKHVVFKTNDTYKDNKPYFDKLYSCFTSQVDSYFYSWLYYLKLTSDFSDLSTIIRTKQLTEIITLNLSNKKDYIEQLKSSMYSLLLKTATDAQDYKKDKSCVLVEKTAFYKSYKT